MLLNGTLVSGYWAAGLSMTRDKDVRFHVWKHRDILFSLLWHHETKADFGLVNPISFLKSPMILIAVVGLGFVIGMPYLLDSSKCGTFLKVLDRAHSSLSLIVHCTDIDTL